MPYNKQYVTTDYIERKLDVVNSTVTRWIREGKIKAFRTSHPRGCYRIDVKDANMYLRSIGYMGDLKEDGS